MPFTGREKAFCGLEYAQSLSNKSVQHAFVREFLKQSPTAMQIIKPLIKRLIIKPYKLQLVHIHSDRGQAELASVVSQAECILNMCEIVYEIHISLNSSFKFGGLILILFSIKPV